MPTQNDIIKQFFEKDDISYRNSRNDVFLCNFAANNGNYRVLVGSEEKDHYVVIYVTSNISIHPEMRPAITEFITRANYAMRTGCFEMDLNDGEFRFRTSIVTPGTELSMAVFEKVFYTAISTIDRYVPGVLRIMYGNISPKEMIAEIEG